MDSERVAEWMSAPPIVIAPTTSLAAAQKLMDQRQVRRLPVVQHGRLVGIATLGDLREAQPSGATTLSVYEMNTLLDTVTVAECMTRAPITVGPHTSVLDAAQLMLKRKISGLPVVEGEHVVGMITESYVFRLVIAHLTGQALTPAHSPTIICRHCGTVVSRKPITSISPDMACWNCWYHVHRCENCRFFDSIACMIKRDERYTAVPGQHCPAFEYLPLQIVSVREH